jgi:DNA repair protein RecN (Recombination protein N)
MTLLRLTIENIGLIARAEVTFAAGLTVVTGETGSGKTMLLDALGLALGGRADPASVRTGSESARVVLEIAQDDALRVRLATEGFALADDDDVIVQRDLNSGGRSQGRINGIPASASQLRALIGTLVDVVSQHEAQRLLTPAYALELLDRFAGDDALALRDDVRELHAALRRARERAAALRDDDGRAAARAEFSRFAVNEIDAAQITADDEDERLRERRDVLANAERIIAALGAASDALGAESGAVDALGSAEASLLGLARFGERFMDLTAAANALQSDANELAARLARERESVELDPAELDGVSARLDTLDRLKKKYGGSLAAVLAQRETLATELLDVEDRDARVAEAEREIASLETALAARAGALSKLRTLAADGVAAAVATELAALAMPAGRLRLALQPLDEIGPTGAEHVELRFAANPGEAERPLAKVASGGELSRVLLAVVVVLADRRDRTALLFDEIDAGIGGATATAVGVRLARLARSAQVVCVTHLAQIASYGDAHLVLRKHVAGGATTIDADELGDAQRPAEIARMLAGEERGVALAHAVELLAAREAAR